MTYYSALHYAAKAKKSEEKAAEYLQQVSNKITTVEGSIGDIGFAPLGIDESQNKRRYLNGQVISQAQFKSFTNKIKSAIELYPSLATSETNWQAEVTNSKLGQCGKFVIDDELGTIRLPKVVNIQGLSDLSKLAEIVEAGLPNITGGTNGYASGNVYGAFKSNNHVFSSGSGGDGFFEHDFNASWSNPIYGNSNTVQQEAIQYPYFIQVATGVEESVDVTREIELNNPFSLLDYKWSEYEITNASWLISNGAFHSGATYVAVYELLLKIQNGTETKDGVSVKLSTEAYTDTDFVINTADTTFRLPIKVKLASGNAVVGNGMNLGMTNGKYNVGIGRYYATNISAFHQSPELYGAEVGTTVPNTAVDGSLGITTDPTKSGIETSSSGLKLYFYVGETIQDANVIAASGVLSALSNKVGFNDRETVVGWVMPDYSARVSKSKDVEYTAECSGWIKLYLRNGTTDPFEFFVDGESIFYNPREGEYYNTYPPIFIGKGQKYKLTKGGTVGAYAFYPCKGVI